jgi:hypothetical protein
MVENAVRSRPAAASSAIEINRLQKISRVTGSKASAASVSMAIPLGDPLRVRRKRYVADMRVSNMVCDRIDMRYE